MSRSRGGTGRVLGLPGTQAGEAQEPGRPWGGFTISLAMLGRVGWPMQTPLHQAPPPLSSLHFSLFSGSCGPPIAHSPGSLQDGSRLPAHRPSRTPPGPPPQTLRLHRTSKDSGTRSMEDPRPRSRDPGPPAPLPWPAAAAVAGSRLQPVSPARCAAAFLAALPPEAPFAAGRGRQLRK